MTVNSNMTPRSSNGKQEEQAAIPLAVYVYAGCAALNSCNLGYDLGVSTNAGPLIQSYFKIGDKELELFLGSLNLWSIFGALFSPIVTDAYGRRATFQAAAIAFICGCLVMASSTSFEMIMVGRFLVGLAVGIGEAVDPMYIAEVAPASIRGWLVSWAEAGVAFGVILGFSSSLVFYNVDESLRWRFMLGTGAVLPFVMICLVQWVMPESPRWLLSKKQTAAARVILENLNPKGSDIDAILMEMESSLELERAASQATGWGAILWPSPAVKRMLLVGIGMAIIQQAIGIDSIMFYLLFVIQGSGVQSEIGQTLALIALGTVKFVFVFIGARMFDTSGRRPLLFVSLLGCAASLVLVSGSFAKETRLSEFVVVFGLACYLASFSIGVGPGNWVVVSEVFSTSIRAKAMSLAVLPNRITATIMASSFLTVASALTWPGFFLLLAAICLASCLFLFVYLPETKGKSLEEMSLYFAEVTGDRTILDAEMQLRQDNGQATQSTAEMTTLDSRQSKESKASEKELV